MPNFGYSYNADRIATSIGRMEEAGIKASFSAEKPTLKGYWKRRCAAGVHVIVAQADEKELTGTNRKSNRQGRGTCVGQGSSRAIEDVHTSRIVDDVIEGIYTQIAYEIMYGFERHAHWSRTHPWGCQCGNCDDGLMGADAAAFYTIKGCLRRANYAQAGIDLSKPREELAIQWNNTGVPEVLLAACKFHKIKNHIHENWDDYADAMAAKCWGHICLMKVFGYSRVIKGPYGTVEPDSDGGHDTECCGIVKLPNDENGFIIQQSWGDNIGYPSQVETADGPLILRPGSYCVRQSILESIGGGQELISCDIESQYSFRSLGETPSGMAA